MVKDNHFEYATSIELREEGTSTISQDNPKIDNKVLNYH